MSSERASDRPDVQADPHLIAPFSAFFGPVYRLQGDARAMRREWVWNVSLGMMVVCTLLLMVYLTRFAPSESVDFNVAEYPAVFWGWIATVLIVRWVLSAIWLVRRRASLRRVEPSLGLDSRLEAAHGPASLVQLRSHAWIMSALALLYLVPAVALADRYPAIVIPMALIFVAQAGCAIRLYRFRNGQGKTFVSRVESNDSGRA